MTIIKKIKKNKGFVILFAVTLSAILLSIALGVANIALKEIKFGTSAKDTNDAFFAADTGAECALYNDKGSASSFGGTGPATIQCLGNSVSIVGSSSPWTFTVAGMGSTLQSCAKVIITKTSSSPISTSIVSKGYNNGGGTCVQGTNAVERELDLNY